MACLLSSVLNALVMTKYDTMMLWEEANGKEYIKNLQQIRQLLPQQIQQLQSCSLIYKFLKNKIRAAMKRAMRWRPFELLLANFASSYHARKAIQYRCSDACLRRLGVSTAQTNHMRCPKYCGCGQKNVPLRKHSETTVQCTASHSAKHMFLQAKTQWTNA